MKVRDKKKSIRRIIHDIEARAQIKSKLPYLHDLEFSISVLDGWEKQLLVDEIYKMEYGEGMGALLQSFDQLNLLSVVDYTISIEDDDMFINILDDFLESHPVLFAKLVDASVEIEYSQSMDISCKLKSYLKDYIYDLHTEPEVYPTNHFNSIWPLLSTKGAYMIHEETIELLLDLEPMSLSEAIGFQHVWRGEDQGKNQTVLDEVLNEALKNIKIAKRLFNLVDTNIEKINCRFYLSFLRILSLNIGSELVPIATEFLKVWFQRGTKGMDEPLIHLMFLTARELTLCLPSFGDYYTWYKATIGEMRYKVAKDEFHFVMKVLSKMLTLEKCEDVLKVHAKSAIPAPAHCNELVVTYKAVVRSKLEAIRAEEDSDVIMIEQT